MGISLSRQTLTAPSSLLARLGNPATGSRIAAARVGDLRRLGFEVVADPIVDDAGHTLLLPGRNDPNRKATQRALAEAFRYVELP